MVLLDDIARRICNLLRAALEERRPERGVPMAEQIMADFLAALPVEEEPGWSQDIEHVARIVAAELQHNAEAWPQAIPLHLAAPTRRTAMECSPTVAAAHVDELRAASAAWPSFATNSP